MFEIFSVSRRPGFPSSKASGQLIPMTMMDLLVASRFSLALGPVDLPSPDELRNAVVELAARGIPARIGFVQEGDRHWRSLGEGIRERVDEMVRVAPDPQIDLRSWLEQTWVPGLPIQFAVTDTRIAYLCDHRLMDARLATVLAPILCGVARGEGTPAWLEQNTRHPLASALLHTFGKRPGTTLRLVGNTLRTRSARSNAQHHTDPASAARGETTMPGNVQHMVGVLERHDLQALRRWARGRLGFSAALLIVAARAFRHAGFAVATTATMVVDLRRYLEGRTTTTGNFIAGMNLPVTGPGSSPEAVEDHVRRALRLGQPLAATALTVLKSKLAQIPMRRGCISTDTVPVPIGSMPARLSMSNSGVLREIERMSWLADPPDRTVECIGDAVDPSAIGFLTCVVDGRLRIGVSFQSQHHSARRVRSALGLMTSGTADLLN